MYSIDRYFPTESEAKAAITDFQLQEVREENVQPEPYKYEIEQIEMAESGDRSILKPKNQRRQFGDSDEKKAEAVALVITRKT